MYLFLRAVHLYVYGQWGTHIYIYTIRIKLFTILFRLFTIFVYKRTCFAVKVAFMPMTLARRFGLDDYASGACVHKHVTPRVISLVIAAAHRSSRILALTRQCFRFWARQVACHAPRTSGLLDQTLLTALAAHSGTCGGL